MSLPLPSAIKRHFVTVMPQTLHVVRTVDQVVEFCGECPLSDTWRVQDLLDGWSEGTSVRGITAVAPEPAWWHLGDFSETRTLQTDADVRRFAGRLAHGWREPLEMLACNAVDGKGISPAGDERWVLGVTPSDALAAAAKAARDLGIVTAAIGSAALDSVAAAVTAVRLEGAGVVQLLVPGRKESHVFTITVRGIEAVDRCPAGFDAILAAAREVFGLATLDEAARRFFGPPPDRAAAAQLAARMAPQLVRGPSWRIESGPAVRFACAGLTGRGAWFGRALASAIGTAHWQPKLGGYLHFLELRMDAEPADPPSLSLLGTLHLAAIHPRRTAAWHPSWGLISRTAAPRRLHRPVEIGTMAAGAPAFAPIDPPGIEAEPEVRPEGPRPVGSPGAGVALPSGPMTEPVTHVTVAGVAVPTSPLADVAEPAPDETPTSEPTPAKAELPVPEAELAVPGITFPPPRPEPPAAPVEPARLNGGTVSDLSTPTPEPAGPADPPPGVARPRDPEVPLAAAAALAESPASEPPRATEPRRGREAPRATEPPPRPAEPASPAEPTPLTERPSSAESPPPERSRPRRRTGPASREPWSPSQPWLPQTEAEAEPTVIVVRRSGYWPIFGLVLALCGAVVAVKYHRDAQAIRATAERERRTSEQAQEMAEREIAAAVEQVRRAAEQAAEADIRAREVAATQAREVERVRAAAEAARREAVEKAKREAAEQARREAEEQTVRLLARELAAARAATAPGTLNVATVPAGAEVQVDGRPPERTPATVEDLPAGSHNIRVSLPGHVPQELTTGIAGAKVTEPGPIKLEPATGSIVLAGSPAEVGFSIRAAGTPADDPPLRRGRTPAQLDDLPQGEYVIQFSRTGWPDRVERVTVKGGATARVTAAFKGGTVRINSSPNGATVLQDGLRLGHTPLTIGGLAPQKVTYELVADGHEPLKVSGAVTEGGELELDGTLLNLDRIANVDEVRTPPLRRSTAPLSLGRLPRSTPPQVTVSCVVLLNGTVEDVRVLGDVDRKLAGRIVEAVSKWKFYPGVSHAGYPVKVRMTMPVKLGR